jgi:hypothetical protein
MAIGHSEARPPDIRSVISRSAGSTHVTPIEEQDNTVPNIYKACQ